VTNLIIGKVETVGNTEWRRQLQPSLLFFRRSWVGGMVPCPYIRHCMQY